MNININGYKVGMGMGIFEVNNDSPVAVKEEFFEKLNKNWQITRVYITRRLEQQYGKKDEDRVVGRFAENAINDNGTRLITFANIMCCV